MRACVVSGVRQPVAPRDGGGAQLRARHGSLRATRRGRLRDDARQGAGDARRQRHELLPNERYSNQPNVYTQTNSAPYVLLRRFRSVSARHAVLTTC